MKQKILLESEFCYRLGRSSRRSGEPGFGVPATGALLVFVRAQRLHVLKISYQQARRKDVVQEIAGSFQFLDHQGPAVKAKPPAKISRVPRENHPKESTAGADH